MATRPVPVQTEFVHDVFSHIAKQYDVMNSVLSFNQHKFWRRFAMGKMKVFQGAQCLDVATGTGDWAISLAHTSGKSGHVTGLDFCQEMLDVSYPKIAKHQVDQQVTMIQGDAMQLPFADNSFDFVTIGFGLRNMPDLRQVLREMQRVAKPGAKIVCLELSKPTFPPFKALYYAYFNHILPFVGKVVVRKSEPYRWLPQSLIAFPSRKELAQIFRETGLLQVEDYALTGGICALHIGTKPLNQGV
nr:demethylmenaquinone methyltransferase [Bacilli bacterium]